MGALSERASHARPSPLALSRPLLDWLRCGSDWRQRPWHERVALQWQAHWGSWNTRLSRAVVAQSAPTLDLRDPLLIVGPWRSGTTVMHELLTAASGYPTPTTWQCMDPCAFALRRTPPVGGVDLARPMDGLAISATSPQEDEFALLSLGAASHYRAFLAPSRIGEMTDALRQDYWLLDRHWMPVWEAFLRAVLRAAAPAAQSRPLLLKSPNHSFRLQAILRRFPGARVLWMARDAGSVLASNRKMWQQMFARYGSPGSPAPPGALDGFLAQALVSAADALAWCLDTLPRDQLAVVGHEALAVRPEATIEQLRHRWGRDWTGGTIDLHRALNRVQSGTIAQYGKGAGQITPPAVKRLDAEQERALQSGCAVQ